MKIESIPLSSIIVQDRARTELGEIGALATSIQQHGLLQPLVLDTANVLQCGARRLAALKLLGWTEAPVRRLSDLTPIEQLEIELDENTRRKDFTWQEDLQLRCKLSKHYADVGLSPVQIAERFQIGTNYLLSLLSLHKLAQAQPELLELNSIGQALISASRIYQNKLRAIEVKALYGGATLNTPIATPTTVTQTHTPNYPHADISQTPYQIVRGDNRIVLKNIPNESVDMVLTDPPFGVDYNYWEATLDDSTKNIFTSILPPVLTEIARVLKPGAHAYFIYPMLHHVKFVELVAKTGLRLHFVPLIWDKQSGPPQRECYGLDYEPILLAYKPPTMRTLQHVANTMLRFPNLRGERQHPTQRPLPLLKHLIELATIPGELVLDPFAGSGSSLIAALQLGRHAIAIEQDPAFHDTILMRLHQEYLNVEATDNTTA